MPPKSKTPTRSNSHSLPIPNHSPSEKPIHVEPISVPFQSDSIKNLATALCKFQHDVRFVPMDSEGYGYSYASLAAVIEAAMEPLFKHGLSVAQFPHSIGSRIGILSYLMHTSGEYIAHGFVFTLPEVVGSNAAQKGGSAITYARRYAFCSILGLVADEDTDAADE